MRKGHTKRELSMAARMSPALVGLSCSKSEIPGSQCSQGHRHACALSESGTLIEPRVHSLTRLAGWPVLGILLSLLLLHQSYRLAPPCLVFPSVLRTGAQITCLPHWVAHTPSYLISPVQKLLYCDRAIFLLPPTSSPSWNLPDGQH